MDTNLRTETHSENQKSNDLGSGIQGAIHDAWGKPDHNTASAKESSTNYYGLPENPLPQLQIPRDDNSSNKPLTWKEEHQEWEKHHDTSKKGSDLSENKDMFGLPETTQAGEHNMLNWVTEDFAKLADKSGQIPSKNVIDQFLKENQASMGGDELAAFKFLGDHFDQIAGAKGAVTEQDLLRYVANAEQERSRVARLFV